MPEIEESIVIDRPRAEVYEFMTAIDNVPLYSSNLVEFTLVEGEPRTVGGVSRGVSKVAGRRLEWTSVIREVEEGQRMLSETIESKVPFRLEMRFDDAGSGTKVTFWQQSDSLGGVFGKLADAVVVKMYAHDVRGNLEKAKLLLESGTADE